MDNHFSTKSSNPDFLLQSETDSSSSRLAKTVSQLAEDVWRSAAYAAFQSPLEGITQLSEKVTGYQLPHWQLVNPVEPAELGTKYGVLRGHLQQFGSGVGMALPLFAINGGIRAAAGRTLGFASMGLAQRAGTAAATALVYDTMFRPVRADEADNFWAAKLTNGALTAATVAGALTMDIHLNRGIDSLPRSLGIAAAEGTERSLGRIMLSQYVLGTAVGALNAHASSFLSNKGLGNLDDVAKTAYRFGYAGASLGAFARLEIFAYSRFAALSAGRIRIGC
jgi:hypothetical protein